MSSLAVVAAASAGAAVAALYLPLALDRSRFGAVPVFLLVAGAGAAVGTAWGQWLRPLAAALIDPRVGGASRALLSSAAAALAAVIAVLAVIAAVSVARIAGPLDGALYGAVAGVGFAVALVVRLGGPGAMPLWLRPLWALVVCACWGAVIGLGVGELRLESRPGRRLAIVVCTALGGTVVGYGLAEVASSDALDHAAAGFLGQWQPLVWLAAFSFLILAAIVGEARLIGAELAEESALGVLPAAVVPVAAWLHRRVRRSWWSRGDERRALNRLLLALAFRKRWLRYLPVDRAQVYGLEIGRLRERVRAILNPRADEDDTRGAMQ